MVAGSFNFTKTAEKLLAIKSPELTRMYLENWKEHREHPAWEKQGDVRCLILL